MHSCIFCVCICSWYALLVWFWCVARVPDKFCGEAAETFKSWILQQGLPSKGIAYTMLWTGFEIFHLFLSLTTGCEEVLIFLKLCLLYIDICVVRDWLELTSWLSGDVFNKDLIWSWERIIWAQGTSLFCSVNIFDLQISLDQGFWCCFREDGIHDPSLEYIFGKARFRNWCPFHVKKT